MRSRESYVAALPVLIAIICLAVFSIRLNENHLVYALDDAYIHLAVARNLASSFTWGINAGEFSSPTSSLIWPVVLAPFVVLGKCAEYAPLALNALLAGVIAMAVYRLLAASFSRGIALSIAAVLPLLVFAPTLALAGMEHLTHALLTVLLLEAIWSSLQRDQVFDKRLFFLSLLLGGIRYEALICIGFATLVFVVNRRFINALTVLIAGLTPAFIFAIVSVSNGWRVLPNSVTLKSGSATLVQRIEGNILHGWPLGVPQLLLIAGIPILLYLVWRERRIVCAAFFYIAYVALLFGHLMGRAIPASATIYNYRYETYLLVLGYTSLFLLIGQLLKLQGRRIWLPLVPTLIVLLYVLTVKNQVSRVGSEMQHAVQASNEIYRQQWQMASLGRRLSGGAIAANDIGLMAYHSGHRIVDVFGLANLEVTRAKQGHRFTTAVLETICRDRGVDYAFVYQPSNFELVGSLPPSWTIEAQWNYYGTYILGGDTVNICTVNPARGSELRQALGRL